jgi:hypothetical protein
MKFCSKQAAEWFLLSFTTTTCECCLTCTCDASKQHSPHFNRYANTPLVTSTTDPLPSPAFT